MTATLRSGSLRIVTILGIPIRVHFSWLLIFGLITWSLSTYYFPKAAPNFPALSYWASGTIAALLLFVSVALHELSHSLVALRYNISIIDITLFIFGGVAQMKGEPHDPRAEFYIAIAGPLSSFFLSLIFFSIYALASSEVLQALFLYIARLNLVLGAFNLIPGFPMDGGRVVRAFIWRKTGDLFNATRKAASYGQKIALFMIGFGLVSLFAGLPGGFWLMLIGWFLYSAAQSSYQQASLQASLSGIKVKDIMVRDMVTIPHDTTLDEAVNRYFLRYGFGGFPVMGGNKLLGMVTLREIKDVPRERWAEVTVGGIVVPHDRRWEILADDDAMHALEVMVTEDQGRLVVTEKGAIAGLITRNGIAQYVQIMGK